VYIGANCCIVGKVEIRNNCIIGAGTTIAKGIIPEGSRVVGQKYKILNDS
jgi:serine acetyltransferase